MENEKWKMTRSSLSNSWTLSIFRWCSGCELVSAGVHLKHVEVRRCSKN